MLLGAAAIVAGFALTSPIPQDPAYHLFADARTMFGTANALNVLSNLPFILVGAWGLALVLRRPQSIGGLVNSYAVFFLGIFLTGFGSGYYHLAPGNETLVWDRLPMTIGFAGLFSVVIGEFVSARLGRRLLLPLLVIGAGSVWYWASTEARGAGDLRPYAVVQFLPMLLTVAILTVYGRGRRETRYFWFLILFYVLAKVAEFYDAGIYAAGSFISGHSLKHLLASVSPAALIVALSARRAAGVPDARSGGPPH